MNEMKVNKILLHIKKHMINGDYGFSKINKNLTNWVVTEVEAINPIKPIKRNKKHFMWYKNDMPASAMVYSNDGKKGLLKITSCGTLYKLEAKDYFYKIGTDYYSPYIWVLDMSGHLYFIYRKEIDEVFVRKTHSPFGRDEDLDTYINEKKNKEYFAHIITECLSKEKFLKEYEDEFKSLRRELIGNNFSKESIYGIYESYNKMKKSNKYSDIVMDRVEKILTNIDAIHYDINYEKKTGSFYFTLDNMNNFENINIKVFENFSNKSEICTYNLQAKAHFYINQNYILDAINNAILLFTPINEQEGNYDSIE